MMSDPGTEEAKGQEPSPPENVASPTQEDSSAWSMSSWFNTAKQKTMETAALMKKDLSELKEVMTTEVSELTSAAKGGLDSTVNMVKQQVQHLVEQDGTEEKEKPEGSETPAEPKAAEDSEDILAKMEKSASMGFGWMKSIAAAVTDTVKNLAVEETYKDEDEFTEVIKYGIGRKTHVPKAVLSKIQTSDSTFMDEPSDVQSFNEWKEKFSMAEHDGEVNILLANNPGMRAKFTQLVPSSLDYTTFWTRYFYAVYMAELDAEMNEALNKETPDTKATGDNIVIDQPTSPAHSTDDWSVCSEKNEVEEIGSTQSEESGPGTPQPPETSEEKKEAGWVDWDE